MNYRDPELVNQLAGEYVLGTLSGAARARFERLLRERSDVRSAVWRWESHLGGVSAALQPVPPPAGVWAAIERRVWPAPQGGLWQSLGLWRSWSAVTSTAVIALLLFLMPLAPQPGPDHVGVIGEGSEPLWLISANLETGELSARAVNAVAADVDHVFELWMLPETGAPVSMGLLPVGGNTVQQALPAGLLALLKQSKGIAVSIEPPGGSPTGLPTGPVVHTARIIAL